MTVNVSKPAINVREKLAELDKPTGIAGEAMLRAETPQEQFNLIGAGRRNLIINGDFRFNQRGQGSYINSGDYTADRWQLNLSSGTATVVHQRFADGQTDVPPNFTNYLEIDASAGNNNLGLWQHVEDVRLTMNDWFTVSFWAKVADGSLPELEWELGQFRNSSDRADIAIGKVELTSDWKYYSLTFFAPNVTSTITDGTSNGRLYFRQPSGNTSNAAWELHITGIQMERGKVATPFEHRSYGEELALCQRYYQRPYYGGTANSAGLSQSYGNWFHLPTTMRATPTVNVHSGTNFYDYPGGNTNSADLRVEAFQYTASTVIRVKHIGNNSRIYLEGTTEADAEL